MTETAAKPLTKRRVLAIVALAILIVLGVGGGIVAHWLLRPNRSFVRPDLKLDHWAVVADGRHNSNTDLIFWRGEFYLVHASSPWHFGSEDCHLLMWRSPDAEEWERLAEFQIAESDIRDPKFAIIHDRLFMYVLKNDLWNPEPLTTQATWTDDGVRWQPLVDVKPEGWLFWRPKTRDGA